MYRIPLFDPETHLLLSPRWLDIADPVQAGLWIATCLLPICLVIWLYRSELRLIRRPVAFGLLLCRLAVLWLLLFVVSFEPIIARSGTEHLPSQVFIAVDRSGSMDLADPQRPAVDKLRLARILKLAGDLCIGAQLDDWTRQYDEFGRPRWVTTEEGQAPASEQRPKLMEAGRHLHDQVCQRVDRWTRSNIARRILSDEGLSLLPALAAKHRIELMGFARDAWHVEPDRLDQLFAKNGADPSEIVRSSFTDLGSPLARALEGTRGNGGRVLGVILLTDGQHNRGPSPVVQAQSLAEQGLPIYPIALGTRQAPPDISMVGIKAPSAVFKDTDAHVEARLKVSGLPAQEMVVQLQGPGLTSLEERFHHDGTDRYYTVPFQVRLEKAITQSLSLTVKPVPGEICTDNNSRQTAIQVAPDTARVLLIDGEARWEYHYLANALSRDRTVDLQTVVFAQPRLGRISEDELAKIGSPRLTLPTEPDALAAYDCIMLGDVSPAQLSSEDQQRLERYVADRGGTLVISAGKRFMPLAFGGSGSKGKENEPSIFSKLLPIEEPRAVSSRSGFAVTLTHDGKSSPFLQMEPTKEGQPPSSVEPGAPDNESLWSGLPRHFWGVIGRSKPAATTLACVREATAGAQAKETERALIVRHNYGLGRVLFIGLESTWRWRYKVGDRYHHRFWGQVVRWAASDKPLAAGNKDIRFGTRDALYRQGQEIELQARLGVEAGQLRPGAPVTARILREPSASSDPLSPSVALVPLTRREAQPRVLEGRFRDLPPGQYAMEVAIPEWSDKLQGPPGPDGKPTKLRASFTVLPPESEEMVELATNFPLLEELAAKSGGKVFTPENTSELLDLLARREVTREHYSEHRLWQWWATLALVLFLLTTEWIVRKWAGLP
jgi:hypothetical protein